MCSWKPLHLVDSDRPADKKENHSNSIKPMIVTVQFLLALIDFGLKRLNFLFIDCSFHQFHIFEFGFICFIDFLEDEFTPNEREWHCGNKSNNGSPYNHGRSKKLISIDGCNEDSLKSPVDQ